MVFLEAMGGMARYGSPGRRAGQTQAQQNYQPFNQDGSRNVDPSVGQISRRDQEYNQMQKWFDPGGLFSKKRKAPRGYLWNDATGGYNSVLESFEQGRTGSGAIQDILTNFKGSREELADFMEVIGPMMGGLESNRLERSGAFQYMQDPQNWDQGAYSGYGLQAGGIGQGTRQAQQQAGNMMASAGLGRSSGSAAIQAMLAQQGSSAQAQAAGQTQMMAEQNRMRSATQMQDAYRLLSQMTMSQGLLPRINSPQGGGGGGFGGGGIAGGAMAGAQLGSAAGPWGALVGGVVGAGAGYAAGR